MEETIRIKGKDLVQGIHSIIDKKGNVYDIISEINYYGHSHEVAIVYDRTKDKEKYKKVSSTGTYTAIKNS